MQNTTKIEYDGKTYGRSDIKGGTMRASVSLLSSSLESNTFNPVIKSAEDLTNFSRNAPMVLYHNDIRRGIFYVQDVKRTSADLYSFSATSAIGLLSEGTHYGGIYTGQTVEEVLPGICGTIPFIIKTNLRRIPLYGWLPIATPRDNLAQVLFAIGATVKTDMDGVLRIESLWDGISGRCDKDRTYQGPSVDYASKITQVIVTEHQYVLGGEETNLFDGTTQQGDIITFNSPMYDLRASGFSILESNVNYARVSAGNGTLTGYEYIHNTRQISKDVSDAAEANIKKVTDATLVSLTNSEAVADRLADFYKYTQTINADAVYHGETPGDILSVWHPYDEIDTVACLERTDIALSNTLKSSERMVVGYFPPHVSSESILENRVVLTGHGVWIPPEGTTRIIAVLVGAGENGAAGDAGTPGVTALGASDSKEGSGTIQDGATASISSNIRNSSAPEAGKGGKGGAGGAPGNILRIEIEEDQILPQYVYSCGNHQDQDRDSSFGSYSSETGSIVDIGYTDPITGEVFAARGIDGTDGADGGSAGSPGNSAGSATGGAPVNSMTVPRSAENESTGGVSGSTRYIISYKTEATFSIGGVGGGGAGGDGENGGDAKTATDISVTQETHGGGQASIRIAAGGNGGNGGDGANGKNYGCGGNGGGGGGGAGCCSSVSLSASTSASVVVIGDDLDDDFHVYLTSYIYSPRNVTAGNGGLGGEGADGCIILYYSTKHQSPSGNMLGRDCKMFLDKYGRLMIV